MTPSPVSVLPTRVPCLLLMALLGVCSQRAAVPAPGADATFVSLSQRWLDGWMAVNPVAATPAPRTSCWSRLI